MDVAYDEVQKEAMSPDRADDDPEELAGEFGNRQRTTSIDLNTEIKEAYKSFSESNAYKTLSESTWGAKLGGFWGTVKKQGESYYEGARQELSSASQGASKGFTDLISHTPNIPTLTQLNDEVAVNREESTETPRNAPVEQPESLPADIVKEAESMFSRFKIEASSKLKQIQKAEDAADEALLKFGTNIRDFLRDAVTVTAPTDPDDPNVKRSLLFESKDAEGRRVVHASRYDAQLHVIHSTVSKFLEDPASGEYSKWKEDFDVDKKTDAIANDLDKYPDLRRAMESVVPEKVEYLDFWRRYYFLRHVVETEEQKRRELLRGTQAETEEIGWDDDDDDDEGVSTPSTPNAVDKKAELKKNTSSNDLLKPNEGRKSNEHSVADSDASYDIVSGATSRTPGSPKEDPKKASTKAEESDDDDWE